MIRLLKTLIPMILIATFIFVFYGNVNPEIYNSEIISVIPNARGSYTEGKILPLKDAVDFVSIKNVYELSNGTLIIKTVVTVGSEDLILLIGVKDNKYINILASGISLGSEKLDFDNLLINFIGKTVQSFRTRTYIQVTATTYEAKEYDVPLKEIAGVYNNAVTELVNSITVASKYASYYKSIRNIFTEDYQILSVENGNLNVLGVYEKDNSYVLHTQGIARKYGTTSTSMLNVQVITEISKSGKILDCCYYYNSSTVGYGSGTENLFNQYENNVIVENYFGLNADDGLPVADGSIIIDGVAGATRTTLAQVRAINSATTYYNLYLA
ncbi:MAG: hypothetical protein WCX32_02355 [Clostridia bacterium]|jgi:hypothetical protein|nr:hypothetical protein [Clostridia bacterium]